MPSAVIASKGIKIVIYNISKSLRIDRSFVEFSGFGLKQQHELS